MKIAVGCDHRGLNLKRKVIEIISALGHETKDFGTDSEASVDYPDFGLKVAREVASGEANFGITVCWTGNGMNIAANKVKGIRAGLALNKEMARLTRLHNNANLMTLSQKFTEETELQGIVQTFLETAFEGGRHADRLKKIQDAESIG